MWPNRILCILLLSLPFEYYFFGRGRTLETSLKLQLGIFLGVWAGTSLMKAARLGPGALLHPVILFPRRLLLATALMACTQLLSAAFAPEFGVNAARAAAKAALGVAIMVAAADVLRVTSVGGNRNDRSRRDLMAYLGVAGIGSALIGLGSAAGIGFLTQVLETFQPQKFFVQGHERFTSTMEYPTTAGSFFAASLLAALALAVSPDRETGRARSRWWLMAVAVLVMALMLTRSRAALGSSVAGIIFSVLALRRGLGPWGLRIGLGVASAVALASVLVLVPLLGGTAGEQTSKLRRTALYGLKGAVEEVKHLLPDHAYCEVVGVANNSSIPWTAGSFGLGIRWYGVASRKSSALIKAAVFDRDAKPSERVELTASYRTPPEEGDYLLIWFVVRMDGTMEAVQDSYSPAVVCSVRSANRARQQGLSRQARDYLKLIQEERRRLVSGVVPSRPSLWLAALRMFRHRPLLGVGSDNFRLLKWKYMNVPGGDETVLANSLYLEFLAGSGILGLAALLWVLWEAVRMLVRERLSSLFDQDCAHAFYAVAYFAAFFLHGLVDYFLKFTPTYLLFWVSVGMLASRQGPVEGENAYRL